MAFVSLVPSMGVNVKSYGAKADGVTDDTTAIQNAINSLNTTGGLVWLPAGVYSISSHLTIAHNITLMGTGTGTILQPTSGFTSTEVVYITGDFAAVRDMQISYANTTYSSNPVANGVQISGARRVTVDRVTCYYINGWMVQSTSSASVANYNTRITNVYGYNCAQGIHIVGNTGSSFGGTSWISHCGMDFSSGTGDCYFIEDSNDVLLNNIFGEYLGGSGTSVHIKGACNGVYVSNFDIGPYPGPVGTVVLIESSTNGAPAYCGFSNGIIEGGATGVSITNGQQITFTNIEIYNNNVGFSITGGLAILLRDLLFYNNGAAGGAGNYDLVLSSAGNGEVRGCHFLTAQGTSAHQTSAAIRSTAGTFIVSDCTFYGTGYNSSNIFSGIPTVIRNCPGYNPLGNITAPTIGSSPYTSPAQATDCTVYVTGGTVSSIAINGVSTGLTSGTFRVPAQLTVTLTYSVAPTWKWFSD